MLSIIQSHWCWACTGGYSTEGGCDVYPPSPAVLLLLSSGQKSWASDHILLQLFSLVRSHSLLEIHSPLSHVTPITSSLIESLERKQVQSLETKFLTLFLNELCLPGRDMLRVIDNSGGQFFSFVFLAKESHLSWPYQNLQALKGSLKSLPRVAVSWFAWMVSVSAYDPRVLIVTVNSFTFDLGYIRN